MLRILAILFGIVLIFAGAAGFVPSLTPNGFLFGFFEVDAFHNIFHLVTGVLAIMSGISFQNARLFFRAFGIVYGLIAILGFLSQGDLIVMHVNTADNFLHLGLAIVSLLLGFAYKPS